MSYAIKLHHLRAFHAVLLTGSVTSAAERLHLTQPAISRQLALLEDATGLCLFERISGGRMRPTPDGARFYREIEGTLEGIEDIPEIARSVAERGRTRLRIGGTHPVINSELFSSTLQRFKEIEPNVRLVFEARQRIDFEEWVARGQVDFGFALLPVENPYIEALPLIDTHIVAVVRSDNPLADRKVLDPIAVRHQPLILPKRQLLRTRIDSAVANAGQTLIPYIEASSSISCCQFAAHGLGIALCDPLSPTAFPNSDLSILSWEPAVALSYGVVWRKGYNLNGVAEKFVACLRDAAMCFP